MIKFIKNTDKYIIFGLIGIFANIILLFLMISGKYTPDTLKGAVGFQGKIGYRGPQGVKGIKGLKGKKGGRGLKGESGDTGVDADIDGLTAGKRIFCSTKDCIKEKAEFSNNTRIWPSDDCINSGNIISNTVQKHIVNNAKTHNFNCGYNWIWSDRINANSCTKIGNNFTKDDNTVKWIDEDINNISPTHMNNKGGFGISMNKKTCEKKCPKCPGMNTRKKKCKNLSSRSRPALVEGTCQEETINELKNNSLIFCCEEDGDDIEKNTRSACKPKLTEYCLNSKNRDECLKELGYSNNVNFRDTLTVFDENGNIKRLDDRCKSDEKGNRYGGDNNFRNWCINSWGCCQPLNGVRRMKQESWRDAYCRNLQMGWIRAIHPYDRVRGTKTKFQPISDNEKNRLEKKNFVCRFVKNPSKRGRSLNENGLGPCVGLGCKDLANNNISNLNQGIVGNFEMNQPVPAIIEDGIVKGDTTKYTSFLGEDSSWGRNENGQMVELDVNDDKNKLYLEDNLFYQCIHKSNLIEGSSLKNLKECHGFS